MELPAVSDLNWCEQGGQFSGFCNCPSPGKAGEGGPDSGFIQQIFIVYYASGTVLEKNRPGSIMKMAKDGLKRDKNGLRFSKDVHFILGSYGKGDGWPVYQ